MKQMIRIIILFLLTQLTGCALMYEPIIPRFGPNNEGYVGSCNNCATPIMPINSYRGNVIVVPQR